MALDWSTEGFSISPRGPPSLSNSVFKIQQECILVGCVPPASMVISTGGVCPGGCLPEMVCLCMCRGVSAQAGRVCTGGVCLKVYTHRPRGRHPLHQIQRQTPPTCPLHAEIHIPPVDRILDTYL